ncbi:MAG TPA: hypothetical protein DCQ32_05440 [Cyanobacteria bacterium UBA8156]|jgi:hypothetical protein|nr:hypothetical protein [Cyanobacteria bacterium UBA8156]
MKTVIGAIALGLGFVTLPAQALTPQERVNLGIGLQVAGCVLGANCGGYAPRYVVPSPGFGAVPYGTVVSPGFGAIPYGTVVSPRFGVSPGLVVIPHGRRVVHPGFGVVPHRGVGWGQFPVVTPRRFYDARAEIDQIYRQVLGRPADLDGLRTYQSRFDEGWSLGQIRNDIANSAEARSRW